MNVALKTVEIIPIEVMTLMSMMMTDLHFFFIQGDLKNFIRGLNRPNDAAKVLGLKK